MYTGPLMGEIPVQGEASLQQGCSRVGLSCIHCCRPQLMNINMLLHAVSTRYTHQITFMFQLNSYSKTITLRTSQITPIGVYL